MSAISNVVISLEPGGHEFDVPPMVAAHINRLQRDLARRPRVYSVDGEDVVVMLADGSAAVFRPSCDIAREIAKRLQDRAAVARERVEGAK